MIKKISMFSAVVSLSLLGSLTAEANAAGHTNSAKVRAIHASPDAPKVDVLVNDQVTLRNVSFATVSDFLTVPNGKYNFKIRPANKTSPTVINANADLAKERSYSVIARNVLSKITPTILTKNKQPALGQTNLKVGHFVPDAPAVNITSLDGNVLISDLKYSEVKDITLPAGIYSVQMRLASDNSKVVTDIANLDLKTGTNYTALALGTLDNKDQAKFQVKLMLD